MNIYDAIVRDYPTAAFKFLTSLTTQPDIMGGPGATSSPAATVMSINSLTSGPSKAIKLSNGATLAMPFPNRFNKDFNNLAFTIECWVSFIDFSAVGTAIMSHTGALDGLRFDGEYVYFRIDLDGGGNVETKWSVPDSPRAYHLAGTYSDSKISLYVNGELVSSAPVPQGSVLASKAANILYAGKTAGTLFMFEAPALYPLELKGSQIEAHYRAGRRNIPAADAVGQYGGVYYTFQDQDRLVYDQQEIDFTEGFATDVVIENGLSPQYGEDDLSVAGSLEYVLNISDPEEAPLNIAGIKFEWDGDGNFSVDYSLDDGSTWLPATNYVVQAGTEALSNKVTPQIRITFPAGRALGLDIVRSFSVTTYENSDVQARNGGERAVKLTLAPPTSSYWTEPIEQDGLAGTLFSTTKHGVLQESLETDVNMIGALEFWVKPLGTGTSSYYIFDSRSVTPTHASFLWVNSTPRFAWSGLSAVYINGVVATSGSVAPNPNEWTHIIAVYTTAHNAKIALGPAGSAQANRINMFAYYTLQLTSSQAAVLYKSYYGPPVLSIEDTNSIVVLETPPAAKVYVKDWSITGGGG